MAMSLGPLGLGLVSPLVGRPGAGFSPVSLFAGGEDGFVYSYRIAANMFQSSAGTTPVTTNNDPVGYVANLVTGKPAAIQAISGSRPLWKSSTGYVQFDGVDDCHVTSFANSVTGSLVARVTVGSSANTAVMGASSDDFLAVLIMKTEAVTFKLQPAVGTETTAYVAGSDLRGSFHTLGMAWNGSFVDTYVDGALLLTSARNGGSIPTNVNNIGNYNRAAGNLGNMNAGVSDVMAINRRLTAAEMLNIHTSWATN